MVTVIIPPPGPLGQFWVVPRNRAVLGNQRLDPPQHQSLVSAVGPFDSGEKAATALRSLLLSNAMPDAEIVAK